MGHNKKIKIGFKFQVSSFRLKCIAFLFCVGLALPLVGQAAKLNLTSQIQKVGISQQFQADLILDTEDEDINAIEGKVMFPADLLVLKEVRDGNSIINLWLERPTNKQGEVRFSGIIPGGYSGERGLIFSLVFQGQKEGEEVIEVAEARALLNDGKGTEAKLSISPDQFLVSKEPSTLREETLNLQDIDPPESFGLEIEQSAEIFEGKYFLVFNTQDKGSGIDHYEIQENKKPNIEDQKWILGKSPYLLQDQKLKSYIYVKVIDRAGNERIAELPPQNLRPGYENYLLWVIIGLGAIIGFLIWKIAKLKIRWPFKNQKE